LPPSLFSSSITIVGANGLPAIVPAGAEWAFFAGSGSRGFGGQPYQ
jgi:hypothetical protein